MVGEGPVQLTMEVVHLYGQPIEHRGGDEAAHAVGGVGRQPQRPQRRRAHEGQHVLDVAVQDVAAGDRAGGGGPGRPGEGAGLDVFQSRARADRRRARAAELDAVVADRVVGRGEHRPGDVEQPGGEVHHLGGAHADVHHVDTGRGRAPAEGRRQVRAVRAHVAADHDAGRAAVAPVTTEGRADGEARLRIDLGSHDPANVVGLEDGVEIGHGHPEPSRTRSASGSSGSGRATPGPGCGTCREQVPSRRPRPAPTTRRC